MRTFVPTMLARNQHDRAMPLQRFVIFPHGNTMQEYIEFAT
jgi:hypothetical protein